MAIDLPRLVLVKFRDAPNDFMDFFPRPRRPSDTRRIEKIFVVVEREGIDEEREREDAPIDDEVPSDGVDEFLLDCPHGNKIRRRGEKRSLPARHPRGMDEENVGTSVFRQGTQELLLVRIYRADLLILDASASSLVLEPLNERFHRVGVVEDTPHDQWRTIPQSGGPHAASAEEHNGAQENPELPERVEVATPPGQHGQRGTHNGRGLASTS
jgi:hypothetical protein